MNCKETQGEGLAVGLMQPSQCGPGVEKVGRVTGEGACSQPGSMLLLAEQRR